MIGQYSADIQRSNSSGGAFSPVPQNTQQNQEPIKNVYERMIQELTDSNDCKKTLESFHTTANYQSLNDIDRAKFTIFMNLFLPHKNYTSEEKKSLINCVSGLYEASKASYVAPRVTRSQRQSPMSPKYHTYLKDLQQLGHKEFTFTESVKKRKSPTKLSQAALAAEDSNSRSGSVTPPMEDSDLLVPNSGIKAWAEVHDSSNTTPGALDSLRITERMFEDSEL